MGFIQYELYFKEKINYDMHLTIWSLENLEIIPSHVWKQAGILGERGGGSGFIAALQNIVKPYTMLNHF